MANRLTRVNRAPTISVAPQLWAQGTLGATTAQKNRTIFCTAGTWTVRENQWMIRRYQWKRNGVNITGATLPFYDAVDDEIGDNVSCVMTALDDRGFTRSVETGEVDIIADARTTYMAASLGFKTTLTTGSITAGTSTLVCADVTGFAVNDYILIECGGEAGAGLRGTMGVGGAWPNVSYANTTAMNADLTKPTGTWAWTTDTGNTYRFRDSDNTWVRNPDGRYYVDKAIPRGLQAKITAIDTGTNTITLDRNATATATSANVHFDNTFKFFALTGGSTYENCIIRFPAGTYAWSNYLDGAGSVGQDNPGVTWQGAGKELTIFKWPKGFAAQFGISGVSDTHFRDIQILGNLETDSYSFPIISNNTSVPDLLTTGLIYSVSTYSTTQNCKFVNCPRSYAASSGGQGNFVYNCDVVHGGIHSYFQWHFQFANTTYGGCYNCDVDSDFWQGAYESFSSPFIYFVDCTGRNAMSAINSAGDVVYDNHQITFEEGKGTTPSGATYVSLAGNAIIDINGNIGISNGGGGDGLQSRPVWIRNPVFTHEFPYGPGDTTLLNVIRISAAYLRDGGSPGVLVSGGYPNLPANGGLFQAQAGGGDHTGINSVYAMVADGIRVTGPNGTILASYDTTGIVRNCVVDVVSGATETNNQTNAEYEA